jgi:predicted MFS family arabinose efflux permease
LKAFTHKYLEFLRQPDVARLFAVALFARMPIGMVGFSMLMCLREAYGNFEVAGSVVGIGFIAMAVGAPIQGRLVDRHGPRPVLRVTGVLQPLSLIAILACAKLGAPFIVTAFFSALSGVFASPITTLTRTLWRYRFDREEDRRIAYALDAVTIEINFTLGPALVAAMLAVGPATIAFSVSIAVVVLSFLIYMSSRALDYFKQDTSADRHLFGPLTEPRLWIVFIATFGLTTCFGMLEVGYPAYATSLALPALGGILLAVNSVGSALGGTLYGGLHFRASVERQFTVALALMALPLIAHVFLLEPIAFGITAFFVGALIAPSVAAQNVLVSRLAPAKYATEAFTWSSTFIVSGLGCGMAVAGSLVENVGLRSNFAGGAALVAAMALLTLSASASSARKPRASRAAP